MRAISATRNWKTAHPEAVIGLLEISGVDNTQSSLPLEALKRETETRLRERYKGFQRSDFRAQPVIAAYERYYKKFDKTYHVQLQLESIVLKAKPLPAVSPLVDANFTAEVETLVLTAGHDVARLTGDVWIDVSREGDTITQMNGSVKALRAGDMLMRDAGGVCCTVIYGQDNRSPISKATTHALYVAYAPAGVAADRVALQLQKIEAHVRLFAPTAALDQQRLISA